LPPAARGVAAAGLIPRDGDVNEALEEVAFAGFRNAPLVFEFLVRREELAAADELNPALEARP
jgi:hypothetical protein